MIEIILLFAAAVHGVSSASCQLGWTEFRGYCYSFSDESLTWFDAAATCFYYNSRLIQVDGETKNNWLVSEVTKRGIDHAWIGGTSRYHQNEWEWLPSLKDFSKYSNWGAGEPNNPNVEQCLMVWKANGYKWNNLSCTNQIRFVCEKKAL